MLNRRILRIKAFKTIYSYAENPSMSLKDCESLLERSCESTRDLYLFLLGFIQPIVAQAQARIDAGRSKFNPTEEEKNPNLKFVSEGISPLLAEDPDFQKALSRKKYSYDQYDVLLRHMYDAIKASDWFAAYMASPEHSLKEDADLWVNIFSNVFTDNAELEDILEDLSILWNDDLEYALSWCCHTVDDLASGKRWSLPALYLSDIQGSSESDKAFAAGIVRKAVLNFEEYVARVSALTPKWDRSRICTPDLCLIISGIAENEAFPYINAKVTINEFVEISKFYSTPESSGFVNGLLDKLINKH